MVFQGLSFMLRIISRTSPLRFDVAISSSVMGSFSAASPTSSNQSSNFVGSEPSMVGIPLRME